MIKDDRTDRMMNGLTPSSRLVELGPSHRPLAPKSDGWNTVVVDYASQEFLIDHYKHENFSAIEPVDVIWSQGRLHEAFPADKIGSFDAFLSSHSLEHVPDAVGLLQSIETLLCPTGIARLALPDKRCCFDFFTGLSSTGDLLSAFANKERVHNKRTSFDGVAYAVTSDGRLSWSLDEPTLPLALVYDLDFAHAVFERASADNTGDYHDFHAWKFTPNSFALIIEELHHLGIIGLEIAGVSGAVGNEFFVELRRVAPGQPARREDINERRLALLKATMLDIEEQIRCMSRSAPEG